MTIVYSGNKAGWLTRVATAIQESGEKPLSLAVLERTVPSRVGTAYNDAAVTCKENGLEVNIKAGYRLWIEGAIAALKKKKLISDDGGIRWIAPLDGEWKVRFAGNQITVRGVAERETARHHHMLGDRPDTGEDMGTPGLLLAGKAEPIMVTVRKGVGDGTVKKGANEFDVHPLAMAIPPMTAHEQMAVLENIRSNGVKVPLVLYPDKADTTARGKPKLKILDGRHRGYFASVTGRPVDVELFEGSEKQARDHVASLNLHRRQLTRQQRALAAERLYGEQARKEAKQDMKRRSSAETNLSEQNGSKDKGKKAHQRVRDMAGGDAAGFSENDAKAAAKVAKAPNTAAAIEAQEITNTSKAQRLAEAEIAGIPVEPPKAGNNVGAPKSAKERAGAAIYELKMSEQEWGQPDADTAAELDMRYAEILQRAERLRGLVARCVA